MSLLDKFRKNKKEKEQEANPEISVVEAEIMELWREEFLPVIKGYCQKRGKKFGINDEKIEVLTKALDADFMVELFSAEEKFNAAKAGIISRLKMSIDKNDTDQSKKDNLSAIVESFEKVDFALFLKCLKIRMEGKDNFSKNYILNSLINNILGEHHGCYRPSSHGDDLSFMVLEMNVIYNEDPKRTIAHEFTHFALREAVPEIKGIDSERAKRKVAKSLGLNEIIGDSRIDHDSLFRSLDESLAHCAALYVADEKANPYYKGYFSDEKDISLFKEIYESIAVLQNTLSRSEFDDFSIEVCRFFVANRHKGMSSDEIDKEKKDLIEFVNDYKSKINNDL